ncbi:MAG: hypothetical protein F6J90_04615 [Moorea sp. SIOASIH]|nr:MULTISPECIES: hypothetical protein [Moorena]NEO35638.1 hypothetical protein [Moorena sp. SIOASIH]NEO96404.1 hypothetical protein [Moorena sp. SIO3G5]NEQ86230.1 hypothetical protein [Moorena sp. SIO2I5]
MPVRRTFGAGRMPTLLLFIQRLTQRRGYRFRLRDRIWQKTTMLAAD